MSARNLTWNSEQLPEGVLRLAFAGRGGIGSEGNPDGEQMREAVRQVLATHSPVGLLIDLSDFEYRFGDWIVSGPLAALRTLGRGRVCVLANGDTGVALRDLWDICRLGQGIPLVGERGEARRYFSEGDIEAGA
jgi:hypothetical protein